MCLFQGGCLWRLVEALRRWSPLHQAADSHKLDQQLVRPEMYLFLSFANVYCLWFASLVSRLLVTGQCFRPVLGQMHPGPGRSAAGGRGAY